VADMFHPSTCLEGFNFDAAQVKLLLTNGLIMFYKLHCLYGA